MHVLIVPSWYPKQPSDVHGSFFREQALALLSKNTSGEKLKVGVIYPTLISVKKIFRKKKEFRLGLQFEDDEGLQTLRFIEYDFFSKFSTLSGLRWKKIGMQLFKEYIKKYGKPDILHAHSMLNGGVLAEEISQIYDIPYILTEHASGYSLGKYSTQQLKQAHSAAKKARKCLAVSSHLSKDLQQVFTNPNIQWDIVPNIINPNFQDANLRDRSPNDDQFTFLTVAFHTKNKSIDTLIRAFAKVSSQYENAILKIGGEGPERRSLENLSKQLNITEKVIFLGKLGREDVVREMLNANVFILASQYESFGVVVIEAMACGLPVIATRCGGPESIITANSGILVPIRDEEALAKAMEVTYKNYDTFDHELIRQQSLSRYSAEAVVNRLLKIYKESMTTSVQTAHTIERT